MTTQNRDRQAAYRKRQRNGASDNVRLNSWVSSDAHFALGRLAKRHGLTRRAMLEKLVIDADGAVRDSLDLGTANWENYFDVTA